MIDILAFGAHPDDTEFGCGGILAKASAQGQRILVVDLTSGDKGTNGTPEIRRKEGEAASKIIGAERLTLDFNDCEILDTYEGRLKLVKVIREYRPRLILAPMWKGEMNHPDHIACGIMARYACRYARFAKILPEVPIYTPEGILHYPPSAYDTPTFLIDVSEHVEVWKQMMHAHQSQLLTYPFVERVLSNAAKFGILIGKAYAQGLVSGNPIAVEDLMTICRGTREL
jgi:N-acetylglucosamine malate deacetylase 1